MSLCLKYGLRETCDKFIITVYLVTVILLQSIQYVVMTTCFIYVLDKRRSYFVIMPYLKCTASNKCHKLGH